MKKLKIKFLVWRIGRIERKMDNTANYKKANQLYWKMESMIERLNELKYQ